MIATLSGRLRRRAEDRVVVECGGIGYEVLGEPAKHTLSGDTDAPPAELVTARFRKQGTIVPEHLRILWAWNAGEGTVRRHGGGLPEIAETRAHVQIVLELYWALLQERQARGAREMRLQPAR